MINFRNFAFLIAMLTPIVVIAGPKDRQSKSEMRDRNSLDQFNLDVNEAFNSFFGPHAKSKDIFNLDPTESFLAESPDNHFPAIQIEIRKPSSKVTPARGQISNTFDISPASMAGTHLEFLRKDTQALIEFNNKRVEFLTAVARVLNYGRLGVGAFASVRDTYYWVKGKIVGAEGKTRNPLSQALEIKGDESEKFLQDYEADKDAAQTPRGKLLIVGILEALNLRIIENARDFLTNSEFGITIFSQVCAGCKILDFGELRGTGIGLSLGYDFTSGALVGEIGIDALRSREVAAAIVEKASILEKIASYYNAPRVLGGQATAGVEVYSRASSPGTFSEKGVQSGFLGIIERTFHESNSKGMGVTIPLKLTMLGLPNNRVASWSELTFDVNRVTIARLYVSPVGESFVRIEGMTGLGIVSRELSSQVSFAAKALIRMALQIGDTAFGVASTAFGCPTVTNLALLEGAYAKTRGDNF